MTSLTVYVHLASQPSRSVLLLLKANKIQFVTEIIDIPKGEHLSSEKFGKVNPNRKVPAIKDEDIMLSESTAIMRYICAKYHLSDHWYPSDVVKRAKIDEYLSWHHTNTRTAAPEILWGQLFGPNMFGTPVDEEKVAKGKKHLAKCMEMYDNHFLKDTPFLSSEEISIADLLALCELDALELLEPNFVELSGKVEEWKKRCIERLGDVYHDVHH